MGSAKLLLEALIEGSEKSAVIARQIREEKVLFNLLIEEKTGTQKNTRFVQDFKTLTDVLIQVTLQHDVGKKFPGLASRIFGEEVNHFTNVLGESIDVAIMETELQTASLLEKVLDGNSEAAKLLASIVHSDLKLEHSDTDIPAEIDIPVNDVGIWIDPIDSTAEYVSGDCGASSSGIASCGLQCVTILIGVFHMSSGEPIMGIINQPFRNRTEQNSWTGRIFWGANWKGTTTICSHLQHDIEKKKSTRVIMSASEDPNVAAKLENDSFTVVQAPGAGYKLLCVAEGLADAYLLTKDSTYKWDTCGPHAILKAIGGYVIEYHSMFSLNEKVELKYNIHRSSTGDDSDIKKFCNTGGFLATRCKETFSLISSILKN